MTPPQLLPGSANEMLGWSTSGWNVTKVAHPHGFVLVIDGFLPPSLADTWHTVLSSTWYNSSACRHGTGPCDGPSCAWLYTTNDNGGNRKIRSVQRIAERRAAAESLRRKGRFCYSKWELTASHELYPSVGALMSMPVMRKQIAGLLGYDTKDTMGNISDYFVSLAAPATLMSCSKTGAQELTIHRSIQRHTSQVTAYDEGDFLTTHNDGASGSAAWVLHLAKGWDKSRGGELRFDSSVNQPTDFAPAFNRMSLFLTRVGVLCDAKPAPMSSHAKYLRCFSSRASVCCWQPGYVPHEVLPVRPAPPQRRLQMMPGVPTASQPRFGLTGWYMTPHDHFTRADIIQNELMKAVSNKAGRCY